MRNIVLFTLLTALIQPVISQEIIYINSNYLNKEIPILIQKPENFQPLKSYPLVFMLHGYSENFKQWSKTTDLKRLATDNQMILVCPEGYVNFYLNSPKLKNFQYEDFFFQELVPRIQKKYIIDRKNIFITGLSMGGYGALSLFIKHPNFFNTAASTSGTLEFDYNNFKKVSLKFFGDERMTNDLKLVSGNPLKNDWKKLSVSFLLENASDFNKSFFIDCGLQDPLLSNTLKIKELALSKNIPIRFSIQPGKHNTKYWSSSIEYHFIYFKQHLITE
ncbi:esterase [Tenacibaculum discolor]|uniref:Alpha/beta hydrolase-fold protein n=1 Tax=Tenacibaculum discolor TaxID=361581 RepID=A0A2G1BQG8_9FLAO|nr:alpha/beta hydrolase-fold protein [Tenacibaculum discolor]MDP2541702.1 alpha/beta hydrolase-fold protein [Tenacibaculum discolor]PHN96296.1 esterase [Tenacibaculum discolor]PHN99431.1 esterase [Rhodobacteraceae bacterium 4F10]